MAVKLEQLSLIQAQLRVAIRELAGHRREVQKLQLQNSALENIPQKVKNIERALEDEATYVWTGGAKAGAPSSENANHARIDEGELASAGFSRGAGGSSLEDGAIFQLPSANTLDCLVKLRKMKAWQSRLDTTLSERLANLKERNTEKELQYKQIVSLCTGVALEHVDEVQSVGVKTFDLVLTMPLDAGTSNNGNRKRGLLPRALSHYFIHAKSRRPNGYHVGSVHVDGFRS